MATSGIDKFIKIWDLNTNTPLTSLDGGHTETISSITISPDETKLVSGAADA